MAPVGLTATPRLLSEKYVRVRGSIRPQGLHLCAVLELLVVVSTPRSRPTVIVMFCVNVYGRFPISGTDFVVIRLKAYLN